mmetsp:Transcript_19465/g.27006  ORF Transcript_19465/g.27006 Transcript_19465/m.27006 type:complete len:308 (+) Transcript_19465:166-1089(+)
MQIQGKGKGNEDTVRNLDKGATKEVSQTVQQERRYNEPLLLLNQQFLSAPRHHPCVPGWLFDLCTRSIALNAHPDGSHLYQHHKFMIRHHYHYSPAYGGPCLDLRSQRLCDESAKIIAWALKTNTTLVGLDLSWNDIGSEGLEALANALLVSSSSPRRRRHQIRETPKAAFSSSGSRTTSNVTANARPGIAGSQDKKNTVSQQLQHQNQSSNDGSHDQSNLPILTYSSSSIRTLGLASNRIGNRGARALTECLLSPCRPSSSSNTVKSVNVSLKVVWLPDNEMIDEESKSNLIHAGLCRGRGFQLEI